MRTLAIGGYALSISLAAALLSTCSGSSIPIRATDSSSGNTGPLTTHSKTFDYTGSEQTFIVPARVKQLTVNARGAQGAFQFGYSYEFYGGWSGRTYAVIPVHPGEKLYVFVGGSGAHGGFNGGGAGGTSGHGSFTGNPGGGASDVRMGGDTLKDRVVVAAGRGGSASATPLP